VDPARFRAVLDRVRAHFERGTSSALEERIERLLQQLDRAPRYLERVLVTVDERSFFLKLDRVSWIESDRNYVIFHAGQERYEVRGTLGALEERLDPAQWLRINRSQIVNIESIAQLEPWFHGEYRILLKDGTRATWSRRYLGRAEEILGKKF
jgi:two-component system LytT family response regulator